MFKLHIYNPEHDIALACNLHNFSIPKAARLTRERFFTLPARWASEADMILVETDEQKKRGNEQYPLFRFVTLSDLSDLSDDMLPEVIEPWGWDRLIVSQLTRANKRLQRLCPTDAEIQEIRRMSSRRFAAEYLLPPLVATDPEHLIGEAIAMADMEFSILNSQFSILKSPWSCSGRGLRFINAEFSDADRKWAQRIIREQGCIMVEPVYDRVVDFAMEFRVSDSGVEYCGLNVFETHNGKYIANLGASQHERLNMLSEHVSLRQVDNIRDEIINLTERLFRGNRWVRHFGIDMMIVDCNGKKKIHPCVEMNLRRTMGQD